MNLTELVVRSDHHGMVDGNHADAAADAAASDTVRRGFGPLFVSRSLLFCSIYFYLLLLIMMMVMLLLLLLGNAVGK